MRLISLTIHTQQNFLIIRVENYCEGVLEFRKELPVTTKADRELILPDQILYKTHIFTAHGTALWVLPVNPFTVYVCYLLFISA